MVSSFSAICKKATTLFTLSSSTGVSQPLSSPRRKQCFRRCNQPIESSFLLHECNKSSSKLTCLCVKSHLTLDNRTVCYLNRFFRGTSPIFCELDTSATANTSTRSRLSCLQVLTNSCTSSESYNDEEKQQIQKETFVKKSVIETAVVSSITNNLNKTEVSNKLLKKVSDKVRNTVADKDETNNLIKNNSLVGCKKKNANSVCLPTDPHTQIQLNNSNLFIATTSLQKIDNVKKKNKHHHSEIHSKSRNSCIRLMRKKNISDQLLFMRNDNLSTLDLRVSKSFRIPDWDTKEDNLWCFIYSREKEQYECLSGSPHVINRWSTCISRILSVSGLDKWRKRGGFGYSFEFENLTVQDSKLLKHENSILMQTRPQVSASDSTTVSSCYSAVEEDEEEKVSSKLTNSNKAVSHQAFASEKIIPRKNCTPVIRQEIREALVQWMSKVAMAMKWKRSTFFIAVHCMDAYLAQIALGNWESCTLKKSTQIEECLPLLSTAALFLGVASEEEHRHTHRVKIFIKEVPKLLSVQQIFIQQLDILTCLQSGLSITRTPEDFVYYFLANMKRATQIRICSMYSQLLVKPDDTLSVAPLQLVIEWVLTIATLVYEKGIYMELQASQLVALCMTPALAFFNVPEKNDYTFFQSLAVYVFKFLSIDVLIELLKQWLQIIKGIVFDALNSGRYSVLQDYVYALAKLSLPLEIKEIILK